MSDWMEWRVVDVEMPTRARTVLVGYDKDITLGQVAAMSEREFRAIPRNGKACTDMVLEVLASARAGTLKLRRAARTLGELAEERGNG